MKKESANWNIAATHYLTTGLISCLLIYISFIILGLYSMSSLLILFLMGMTYVFGTYLGARYATSYIKKTYIIRNSGSIIKYAISYSITISLLLMLSNISGSNFHIESLIWAIIMFIINTPIYYTYMKKNIVNDIEGIPQANII